MGCDAHGHTEIKVELPIPIQTAEVSYDLETQQMACVPRKLTCWEHLGFHSINRNYRLFSFIAGVRNYQQVPHFPVKGFPSDASTITRMDYDNWGSEAHTPTHLFHTEIKDLYRLAETQCGISREELSNQFGWFFGNYLHSYVFGDENEQFPKGILEVRLVFWFDN